jgi:DNA-binding GntR family transcriptional regulator
MTSDRRRRRSIRVEEDMLLEDVPEGGWVVTQPTDDDFMAEIAHYRRQLEVAEPKP